MTLFKSISKIPVIGTLNRVLGLFLGFFNATIIVLALSMLLSTPLVKNGSEVREETYFRYVDKYSKMALSCLGENISLETFKDKIESFNVDEARESFKNWLMSQEIMH